MFAAEATSGACPAAFITRSWSGATTAKAAAPKTNVPITAVTWFSISHVIANITTARAAIVPSTAGIGRQSARRPPRLFPTNRPAPNSSSSGVIHPLENPLTSVNCGAM